MAQVKIAFVASRSPEARAAHFRLLKLYPSVRLDKADVIVALGGDGFMLETLHRFRRRALPIFGMNRGTIGFLMNAYDENGLEERLMKAEQASLHPLRMRATQTSGKIRQAITINEVSLLRETRQAAKIRVSVDSVVRLPELVCDGILIATPAGSTAYNLSTHGPIIPLGAEILALTPISAFRPRRWRGALLTSDAKVRFDILEHAKRPVSAVAGRTEVRDVSRVDVFQDKQETLAIMFDPEHNLEERILSEQFTL